MIFGIAFRGSFQLLSVHQREMLFKVFCFNDFFQGIGRIIDLLAEFGQLFGGGLPHSPANECFIVLKMEIIIDPA
ncbi:hypothetical protein D9M69_684940 [compost metagenome]